MIYNNTFIKRRSNINNNILFLLKNYKEETEVLYVDKNISINEFRKLLYKTIFKKKGNLDSENLIFRINNCVINLFLPKIETLHDLMNKYNKILIKNNKFINLEWSGRLNGGVIKLLIKMVITIFKFFLFIPKTIIWVGELIIYCIKVMIFAIKLAMDITSVDGIMGLVKFISYEVILAPFRVILVFIKRFINVLGKTTIQAVWGADNVDYYNSEEKESSTCLDDKKCYKTPDGTIPFSVIIATILCPPIGVFMEYGLTGWFNIIICSLLTLVFYFPGLIYALILLYC